MVIEELTFAGALSDTGHEKYDSTKTRLDNILESMVTTIFARTHHQNWQQVVDLCNRRVNICRRPL